MPHPNRVLPLVLVALLGVAGWVPLCAAEPAGRYEPAVTALEPPAPTRILFVGNSYLYYNDSVHNHVRRIVAERQPDIADSLDYKSATIGGATLLQHDLDALLEPGRFGADETFELVILQGNSAETLGDTNRARFRQGADQQAKKVRAAGAQVALYMTHAYRKPHSRYAPDLIDTIAGAYVETGNRLQALVIPVGLAFELAYARRPEIQLHKSYDGSHPSLLGTYLAACVVYASVYGQPASGTGYDYFGDINAADARFLQAIAYETVRAFFGDAR